MLFLQEAVKVREVWGAVLGGLSQRVWLVATEILGPNTAIVGRLGRLSQQIWLVITVIWGAVTLRWLLGLEGCRNEFTVSRHSHLGSPKSCDTA